jgi:hypothetical protein
MDMSTITERLQKVSNKEVRGRGFSVLVPSPHEVLFRQDDHVAVVEIEGGVGSNGKVNWLLYAETLRGWEHPHAQECMSAGQSMDIIRKIMISMDMLSMPHEVVPSVVSEAPGGTDSGEEEA